MRLEGTTSDGIAEVIYFVVDSRLHSRNPGIIGIPSIIYVLALGFVRAFLKHLVPTLLFIERLVDRPIAFDVRHVLGTTQRIERACGSRCLGRTRVHQCSSVASASASGPTAEFGACEI